MSKGKGKQMSDDNGMKQYLAVETLWDDDLNEGTYEVVFSAPNYQSAEDYVSVLCEFAGWAVELCGELTETSIVQQNA